MAIAFPISLPTAFRMANLDIHANSMVGESRSPFTMEEQVYAHSGEWWEADVTLPPLNRADAEDVVAALLSLNGKEGTFLMPLSTTQTGATARGTWSAASPVINGAHSAGVKTLSIRGAEGYTWKAGDWIQIGTGTSTRLHKTVQDGSQLAGSPQVPANLEIWPRTRAAYSDGQALVVASAKGIWRLASNQRSWSIQRAQIYGIRFSAVEALNP